MLALGLHRFHHRGDQFLSVRDTAVDDLDIHGGLAGLARALAIHPMLADENEGVGKQIERYSEAAALQAHLEFEAFEVFFTVLIDGHSLGFYRRIRRIDIGMLAGLIQLQDAPDFVLDSGRIGLKILAVLIFPLDRFYEVCDLAVEALHALPVSYESGHGVGEEHRAVQQDENGECGCAVFTQLAETRHNPAVY